MSIQVVAQAAQEKATGAAYGMSLLVGSVSALSAEWIGMLIGAVGVAVTVGINWHYRKRGFEIEKESERVARDANRAKRDWFYHKRKTDEIDHRHKRLGDEDNEG